MDAYEEDQSSQKPAGTPHGLHFQKGFQCHADHFSHDSSIFLGHRDQPNNALGCIRRILCPCRCIQLLADNSGLAINLLIVRSSYRTVFQMFQMDSEELEEVHQEVPEEEKEAEEVEPQEPAAVTVELESKFGAIVDDLPEH